MKGRIGMRLFIVVFVQMLFSVTSAYINEKWRSIRGIFGFRSIIFVILFMHFRLETSSNTFFCSTNTYDNVTQMTKQGVGMDVEVV